MNLTLHVWRQKNANDKGRLEKYEAKDINHHMSFLEMLDVAHGCGLLAAECVAVARVAAQGPQARDEMRAWSLGSSPSTIL